MNLIASSTSVNDGLHSLSIIKFLMTDGYKGAKHLRESAALSSILEKQKAAKKLYGAVCASPAVVLAPQGLLVESSPATCYPAPNFRETLKTVSDDKVVVADNVVTSQGPGTSLLFALSLGEQLFGKEVRIRSDFCWF